MNKSPTQWAEAFKSLSKNDNYIVEVSFTLQQLEELAFMMEQLSLAVDIDNLKQAQELVMNEF